MTPQTYLEAIRAVVTRNLPPSNPAVTVPLRWSTFPEATKDGIPIYGETTIDNWANKIVKVTIYGPHLENDWRLVAFDLVHELGHAADPTAPSGFSMLVNNGHGPAWISAVRSLGLRHDEGFGWLPKMACDLSRWNPHVLAEIQALPRPDGWV